MVEMFVDIRKRGVVVGRAMMLDFEDSIFPIHDPDGSLEPSFGLYCSLFILISARRQGHPFKLLVLLTWIVFFLVSYSYPGKT